MSKRKPPPSKRARSSTIEAKAQRATQAIVKSPKVSRLYSVVADPTEPPHSVATNQNKSLSLLRIRRQPYILTKQNKSLSLLRIRRQPKMTANRR
jgi:hypothetical protein